MTVAPFAAWMPDAMPLNGGASIASGVIARSSSSYGPFPSPVSISDPLPGPVLGAYAATDPGGNVFVYAGTASALWEYRAGSVGWILRGTGYTATRWRFTQFKTLILATNGSDPVQAFTIGGGGLFSVLSSAAPKASFITTVRDFVVLGSTTDPVGGSNAFRIWWSGISAPSSWPTPGSTTAQAEQSDYNDFSGAQGPITGFAENLTNADFAVFFARSIQRGIYSGAPDIFQFQPAEGTKGLLSPESLVQVGPLSYYLAEDGFYSFDGAFSRPIGVGAVDRWFLDNMNWSFPYSILGAFDGESRALMWAFASNASLGLPDTVLVHVPDFQRWSVASVNVEWFARVLPVAGGVAVPRAMPFLTTHQLGQFTGLPMAAQVSTAEQQLVPGRRALVRAVRPLVDGGAPTVALLTRNRLPDPIVSGGDVGMDVSGECPFRVDARFFRALVKVPAGDEWTHAEGVDFDAVPAGWR